MSKFSLYRDLNKIQWGKTIALNVMRAFSAGIICTIFILISGTSMGVGSLPAITIPFIAPIAYICILPFFTIVLVTIEKMPILVGGGFIAKIVSILLPLFVSILMSLGDPLIYLLHQIKPEFVPIKKFNFINLEWCLFVLDPKKVSFDS
jgi:hypothetical protein